MPVVANTIQEPLSNASTVALSSTLSQQEPDSITNMQLEEAVAQKVAADVSSIRAREISPVISSCMPEPHNLNGQDKMVQFKGLYVVRGPTEAKHVRYTMDIADAELQLRGRCIQRFHSFFLLRKHLLEVLKTCHGRLLSRKSTLTGVDDEPQTLAGAELVKILTRPRCIQCPECESTYDQLAAVTFPRRTLFPPSLQDIHERSKVLETFLDHCVRIATTWPACQRSKRLFTTVLGKFLGMDMKAYLITQKEVNLVSEARTVVTVNTDDDEEQQNDFDKTELTSEIMYLPSPREVNETFQSSDNKDTCHSEPNFSFISNPSKEGNEDIVSIILIHLHTIKYGLIIPVLSETMNAAELAQSVHCDGFVVLPKEPFQVSDSVIDLVRTQVLNLYEEFLTKAANQQLDLKLRQHAERLPGFYVREGGRIDMQLRFLVFQTQSVETVHSVDMNLLKDMVATWQSVLTELFAPDDFRLEYVGCVLSRPGDVDQNWHLDGVHRNQQVQEPVDRLNVFVPLVAITDQIGGTEMKMRSHIHDNGARGTAFEGYQNLPSVTACVEVGTPIIMDYRVWHRGLANTSESTVRPLLYFKYAKTTASVVANAPAATKKRKRITPMVV